MSNFISEIVSNTIQLVTSEKFHIYPNSVHSNPVRSVNLFLKETVSLIMIMFEDATSS